MSISQNLSCLRLAVTGAALFGAVVAQAQTVCTPKTPEIEVLRRFGNGAFGANPTGRLLFSDGKLFGTTSSGGAAGLGTIFSLAPPIAPSTVWRTRVLHNFQNIADGAAPEGALIVDTSGALYGTTTLGGGAGVNGVVFKLAPPVAPSTTWTYTVLHSFTGGPDGAFPKADLVFDTSGALYGTTESGGAGFGVVFKLTPPVAPSTTWTHTTISTFAGGADGANPRSTLTFQGGKLYGTTFRGGTANFGTIFELTPPTAPATTGVRTVIHSFQGGANGIAGGSRNGALTFDSQGAIYGAGGGGAFNSGVVYKLTPPTAPATNWTQTVLYSFPGGSGGASPNLSVVFDGSGNIYGTTAGGGFGSGFGTVFRVAPPVPPATAYTGQKVFTFSGFQAANGALPRAGLIMDTNGALYGTASAGGGGGAMGVVFKIK